MENQPKIFKCKKLKLDLPKISNQTSLVKSSSKQNMDPFINTSSSRFKDFKKLFFQYKSNARILQKSPYYTNTKQRKHIIEMMTTQRYQMTDNILKKIQEKYGVNQELYKNQKRIISVKLIYQNRTYCLNIKAGVVDQFNKKLKYELAKIMVSLKNTFKKCEILQGFQTNSQNNQIDFILSCKPLQIKFSQISLRPIFYKYFSAKKISISDFKFIKCLGCGGFSTVYLVKGNFNGKYYALKLISKSFIIESQRQGIVQNERYILGELRSSFVTQLQFAFQSKNHFVLVVEYCPGGELFYQLKKVRRMSQDEAKFYFLEILVGLDYIHSKNIVYRDLKPQNLLIALDGHIKIADFGLSKPVQNKKQASYSFCGSPEYMAPEMLLKQGHTYLLDYYCLGALLYELVVGIPPYYSLNHEEIYQSILREELSFPSHTELSEDLMSLLRKLLEKNSKKRLGSMFGIKQILLHPWVGKIKQSTIENKQLIPPFVPILQNFNFDLADMKNNFQEINKKIQDDMLNKRFETHFSDEFYFQKPQFKDSLISFKQYQQMKNQSKSKSLDQHIQLKFTSKQKQKQFTTRKLKPSKSSSKILSMTVRK